MSTEQGKKFDEIRIDFQTKMFLRWHADDMSFTVEAGDAKFHGANLKDLIEQGRVHLAGWDKVKWEPVISVSTDIYSDMSLTYERCYRGKHKGKFVFRKWKMNGENEPCFGRVGPDADTGDVMVASEPGDVMSRACGRVLPYTPERWTRIRNLAKMLAKAVEDASAKLSEMLKQDDLDVFLENAGGGSMPKLVFDATATAKK